MNLGPKFLALLPVRFACESPKESPPLPPGYFCNVGQVMVM